MQSYYELYRNSYMDFSIFNDTVPYFSAVNEQYIPVDELDEKNLIRVLDRMNISISTYYPHLYDPKRILRYDKDDILSFYKYFTNWNDLMSAIFSVPLSKSMLFVKIDRSEVIRDKFPENIDKKIVENCNNIIYTLQNMCGPDTNVDPNSISTLFDKSVDLELTPYRKELAIKALEEYFTRFFLLFGYVVNYIPDESGIIPIHMRYTYNIFKKYYDEVLIFKDYNPNIGAFNLYARLYEMKDTLNKSNLLLLGKDEDNRLSAKMEDRSVVVEPYFIKNGIIKSDKIQEVHFFNIIVYVSYLCQELIDKLTITPMTKLETVPEKINTKNTLYEFSEVVVDTDADDFSVETENHLIVGVEKLDKKFKLLFRDAGTSKITIRATREGYLENVKSLDVSVIKPESTILTADPKELNMKIGETVTVNVFTNANDYAFGLIGDNVESVATIDEPEQGKINVTAVGNGNVKLRLIAKTLDLPTTVVYVPITVSDVSVQNIPLATFPVIETVINDGEESWNEEASLVSEEQLREAFYFTKRIIEAYVLTNVKSKREKEKVSTLKTYRIFEDTKNSIFEPYYLNLDSTLNRASDTSRVWEIK